MDVKEFNKLRDELETHSFETNFKNLSQVLYYFSFLGNIFLVLFSFFFLKNITTIIPILFSGQGLFFTLFIIAFMVCYELFKRFSFENLTSAILKTKKATSSIIVGSLVCISLVCGSFYLSLNGAHRLVDNSQTITAKADTLSSLEVNKIYDSYHNRISLKEKQIESIHTNDENGVLNPAQRKVIQELETSVKEMETERDNKIKAVKNEVLSKNKKINEENEENTVAFAALVFFLEFIILIGVAFRSYYRWNSYIETKGLMSSPKFKTAENNLSLLKIFYQNGRKKEGDHVISANKLKELCDAQNMRLSIKEIQSFLTLLNELGAVQGNKRGRTYAISYETAKQLLEENE